MFRNLLASLALCLCASTARSEPRSAEPDEWWRKAVFYQIYPRSYQDSTGDGVGDLPGLISRLDHLQDLGIDAVWLTPIFPSPQVDFGYDVSDYCAIDPAFGTLEDFDRLVAEGRKRGIRVFLDLVLNHTSDQHPWFLDSRSSRSAAKRDWYVWRDGRGPDQPPCNWLSLFGGSAWTLDPATGQYYYHYFYRQQPDLNWRNPEVVRAIEDVTRFWYRRGVAGFRLDAVDTVFEDPELHDNPVLAGKNPYGDANMKNVHNYKLEENHRMMQGLRKVADEFGAVLIGESYTETPEELAKYYGDGHNELQMPTGHILAMAEKLDAMDFRARIQTTEATGFWPVWVLGNHDLARTITRYGDGRHNAAIAKVLGALQLTLRGTPILYYGEELGMENNDPKCREDCRDPLAILGWPTAKKRDGARTPMPWAPSAGAGFTRGRPWLPIPPAASTLNVETQRRDPDSVLTFYRALLALRRKSPVLLEGDYLPLNPRDPHILSYLRTRGDRAVLVVLNLTARPRPTAFDLERMGWKGTRVALASGTSRLAKGVPVQVGAFGVVVVELERQPGGDLKLPMSGTSAKGRGAR